MPERKRTLPDDSRLPRHIAIVMDGNGRWAKKRGYPRIMGHKRGVSAVKRIVEECSNSGIGFLTLYAFSTENWLRPKEEVRGLMQILRTYLLKELPVMTRNNIRLLSIGDRSKLPEASLKTLEKAIEKTKSNTGMVLILALNYGSRNEIIRAIGRWRSDGEKPLTEDSFSQYLDTGEIPDPDLFIRTSGEMRLSNFLLWQLAYSELYVSPVLWPDFSEEHLHLAIDEYRKRERRFGGTG